MGELGVEYDRRTNIRPSQGSGGDKKHVEFSSPTLIYCHFQARRAPFHKNKLQKQTDKKRENQQ
jgi:hypothetical protein